MMGGTRVRVVLVETEGEANLGFVVRLCRNFDVDELYLVNPRIDPFSEEVRRFSAHGVDYLHSGRVKVVDSLSKALENVSLTAATSAHVGTGGDILRKSIDIEEFGSIAARHSSVAIVFGRESVGLKRDEIAACDLLVHIPANPEYPTLNLSHAVAIALYVLFRKVSRRSSLDVLDVATEESIRVADKYIDKLAKIVGSDDRQRECISMVFRRMLRTSKLTKAELGYATIALRRIGQLLEKCLGK